MVTIRNSQRMVYRQVLPYEVTFGKVPLGASVVYVNSMGSELGLLSIRARSRKRMGLVWVTNGKFVLKSITNLPSHEESSRF